MHVKLDMMMVMMMMMTMTMTMTLTLIFISYTHIRYMSSNGFGKTKDPEVKMCGTPLP